MESYTIKQLKDVIVKYNLKTKIVGYSKQNKDDLIANIKKHLDHNNGTFTPKIIQPIIIKSNFDTTPIKVQDIKKEEPKNEYLNIIEHKPLVKNDIMPTLKEVVINKTPMEIRVRDKIKRFTNGDINQHNSKEKKFIELQFRNELNNIKDNKLKNDIKELIKDQLDDMIISKDLKTDLNKYINKQNYLLPN